MARTDVADDFLQTLLHENVVTPYIEFMNLRQAPEVGESRDLRAGLEAARAVYHFREQLPLKHTITVPDIFKSCPDYALAQDVTNVSKHGELTKGLPLIRRPDQIEEVLCITYYSDDLGEYYNLSKFVQLTLVDGTFRDLADVVTNCVNFWCNYLHRKGLRTKPGKFTVKIPTEPIPRAKASLDGPVYRVTQGMKLRQSLQFRRYNNETKEIELFDLKNWQAHSELFKPRHVVSLEYLDEVGGQRKIVETPLNHDESDQLERLSLAPEIHEFIGSLPQVKQLLDNLAARGLEQVICKVSSATKKT